MKKLSKQAISNSFSFFAPKTSIVQDWDGNMIMLGEYETTYYQSHMLPVGWHYVVLPK